MSKYRAYLVFTQYRSFEFEAADEILAEDHIEHLIGHRRFALLDEADESGPDDIMLDTIEEI
jgi:hypothetical protein